MKSHKSSDRRGDLIDLKLTVLLQKWATEAQMEPLESFSMINAIAANRLSDVITDFNDSQEEMYDYTFRNWDVFELLEDWAESLEKAFADVNIELPALFPKKLYIARRNRMEKTIRIHYRINWAG